MDLFSFITTGVLVYIAIAVFVTGMIYRLYEWFSTPRSPVKLGMFPKPSSDLGRWSADFKDSIFFPQSFEVDKPMWLFAIIFHIAGLMIFIGHLRLIREFTPIANALGPEGMDRFSSLTGGIFGIVVTIAVLYYLFRRFVSPYKDLSVPEDYLLLLLILLIITLGNHLRFFGDVHVDAYRAYVNSLLTLKPAFTEELAASSIKWSFVSHILTVNILLIYFPFSKLTHAIGTFAANLTRSD